MCNKGRFIRFQCLLFSLVVAFFCVISQAMSLRELSEGPLLNPLPPTQFVTVTGYRLKNPKLLWLNVPQLRKLGFKIDDPPTEAQQAEVLEAVAWVTKDDLIQEGEITEETKIFYTDYYGGDGLAKNSGSARAMMRGLVQLRGSGKNPMLTGSHPTFNGRADTHGSALNTVWGAVSNHELPFGGDEILAVISRGVRDSNGQALTIDVRMSDVVRGAHFIPDVAYLTSATPFETMKTLPQTVQVAKAAVSHLRKLLPLPPGMDREKMSEAEIIVEGTLEFTRRLGIQFAMMDIKRMFHGANSESNIKINGEIMDFGTSSTQPGYQRIYNLPYASKFAEYYDLKKNVIYRWPSIVERLLNNDLKQKVATVVAKKGGASLNQLAKASFENGQSTGQARALLWTLGVPDAWIKELRTEHNVLITLMSQQYDWRMARSHTIDLGEKRDVFKDELESVFSRFTADLYSLPDWSDRNLTRLVNSFGSEIVHPVYFLKYLKEFLHKITELAKTKGWSESALRKYLQTTAAFRNRPMDKMYANSMRVFAEELDKNLDKMSYKETAERIDFLIADSVRTTRHLKDFEAPLKIERRRNSFQVQVLDVLTSEQRWVELDPSQCEKRLGITQD